jgi:hexosaminidase
LRYARPLTRFIPFAVVCLIASVACASSMHSTPASAPAVSGAQFVTAEDGRFMLGGQPHTFAGVNFWQAMNLGVAGNREQLLAELDRLQALGVTNVRVMAASEGPNGEPRRYPQAWIDETAAFIKALDPNHLVTSGVEGELPWREQDFRAAHDGPGIDYATVPIWPQNWGWYDPERPASYEVAEAEALADLREHAAAAHALGKPLVLEEFGLARDYEPLQDILDPASPTSYRDRFLAAMLAEVSASAAAGGSLAGSNVWAWSGAVRPGDPWVGDPPHEEPGWYSIYDGDASTLSVLAAHAAALAHPSPEATKAVPMNPLIPLPASVEETGDIFTLTGDIAIVVDADNDELAAIGAYLAEWLGGAMGTAVPVLAGDETQPIGAIRLTLAGADPALGDEGYALTVTPDGVAIGASQAAGVFYGVQTLRQLLPAELENGAAWPAGAQWTIPTVVIRDTPRFAWRGMMLDVARHFPPGGVEDVKRVIDLMALYKLNRLHLHLTDDQGWRLMIESWPRLAEVGGSTAVDGDPGGYFTQAEYTELVAYAASRTIVIVPEIDLPGHTNAALAAYPELNCDGVAPDLYTGIEVGFSSLCIDKEVTYQFVDDVLREVAALTPGPFIHVGGDEAHSTPDADYARFMARVQEIVGSHGKQMLAWEEAARIELAPGSAVQHWHNEMAQAAAQQGAQVIMSPAAYAYLDMKYDDSTALGLNWAGNISVEKAYSWDPATVQPGIPEDAILGVEAPLWTETVRTMDDLEYLVFPRLLGHAEIGWSPAAGRSWDEYRQRLAGHAARLEALGVNFYRGWMED